MSSGALVGWQEIIVVNNAMIQLLTRILNMNVPFENSDVLPNGVRYPRVGGTRERHFAGTNFKPRKPPENAASPTRRVHAVLGGMQFGNSVLIPTSKCKMVELANAGHPSEVDYRSKPIPSTSNPAIRTTAPT
jgi:hypothetical protein